MNFDHIHTTDQGRELYGTLESLGDKHELMYHIAEINPDKGKFNGDCNVTQCQAKGVATWYNSGTNAYYCESCAKDINHSCRFESFYPLCVDESEVVETHKETKDINVMGGGEYITLNSHRTPITRKYRKIGRNETCPCGSGLKHKRCCLK